MRGRRRSPTGLAAAENGQKDLDEAKPRAEDVIREARDRANQIVDAASKRCERDRRGREAGAQSEGDRLVAAAKQQIELETAKAREPLRTKWHDWP